ncbi:MAG: hypothetical protein RMM31_03125 [Anaerolineae bacterium]|nr:hypothetical protein [Thermoflexales bacterium]MDW8395215.1 hypothetical protein [Anaerolineae bacterium]
MDAEVVIADIVQRLRRLPLEQVKMLQQWVHALESQQQGALEMEHDWFDLEAFLTWRREQRELDLALDRERMERLGETWH